MARKRDSDQSDHDQEIREICLRLLRKHDLLKEPDVVLLWLPLLVHVMLRFTELVPPKRMSARRVAALVRVMADPDDPFKADAYRRVADIAGISEDAVRKDYERTVPPEDRTK